MRVVPKPTLLLLLVTALLGVVSAGLPAVTTSSLTTGSGEVRLYVDVLVENNLPTWWATAMLILAAAAASLTSYVSRAARSSSWRRWMILAVLFALLSLDEMTSLHERLDRTVAGDIDLGSYPFLWVIPGALLGIGLLAVAAHTVWPLPSTARAWLLVGFGLLLGSALGGEVVQGVLLGAGNTGPGYVLTYHAEEFGETSGAIALLTGACAALRHVPVPAGGLLLTTTPAQARHTARP